MSGIIFTSDPRARPLIARPTCPPPPSWLPGAGPPTRPDPAGDTAPGCRSGGRWDRRRSHVSRPACRARGRDRPPRDGAATVGRAAGVCKPLGEEKSSDFPPFGPMRALTRDGVDTARPQVVVSPSGARQPRPRRPRPRSARPPKFRNLRSSAARGIHGHRDARFRILIALWMLTEPE